MSFDVVTFPVLYIWKQNVTYVNMAHWLCVCGICVLVKISRVLTTTSLTTSSYS